MSNTNNVLVIGNGFDIHHGMMTRYADLLRFFINVRDSVEDYSLDSSVLNSVLKWTENSFFDYFVSEYEDRVEVKSWIDLERSIKNYVESLIDFFDKKNFQIKNNEQPENKRIIEYGRHTDEIDLMLCNAHAIGTTVNNHFELFPDYISFQGLYDIEAMITRFAHELNELEEIIAYYLKTIEPLIREKVSAYHAFNQISRIQPSYVISFNYTNTFSDLYNQEDPDVTFIHGNLSSNNVVIGYDDTNHRHEDIVFKKYYRRIIKHTNEIKDEKLYYMSGSFTNRRDVYIFGHSLDLSDEDILRPLISNHPTVIFYLNDNDYAIKVRNLFLLLQKEIVLDLIKKGQLRFEKIEDNN